MLIAFVFRIAIFVIKLLIVRPLGPSCSSLLCMGHGAWSKEPAGPQGHSHSEAAPSAGTWAPWFTEGKGRETEGVCLWEPGYGHPVRHLKEQKRKEGGGPWTWSWVGGQPSLQFHILGKSPEYQKNSNWNFQALTSRRRPEQNILLKCLLARLF